MSGPVSADDVTQAPEVARATERQVLLEPGRRTTVGDVPVRRVLPRRPRRTVGAWCFADHMGPVPVTEQRGVDIGPHPHLGLQTVTWLISGEVLHRDSLGSEQVVRDGQLNLMTAGHGVAHSEENTGRFQGELQGIQLWVAQPESTAARAGRLRAPRRAPGGRAVRIAGHCSSWCLRRRGLTGPARHRSPWRRPRPRPAGGGAPVATGVRVRPRRPGRRRRRRGPGGRTRPVGVSG